MIDAPLGVVGTGLIGCSIGLRAARAGHAVIGWDLSEDRLREAADTGAIGSAASSAGALLESARTIVIALPLEATLEFLAGNAPFANASLVVDVASLKRRVAERAAPFANVVATHPLAGSERSGPGAANPSLFEGATWCYVPAGRDGPERAARELIEFMGARPLAIDAAAHDRAMAFTSALPQLLSVVLAERLGARALEQPELLALCGGGMRSMTRLAGSSWSMWRSLLADGGGALSQEVRILRDVLGEAAEELDASGSEALERRFAQAHSAANALAGTSGAAPALMQAVNLPRREDR